MKSRAIVWSCEFLNSWVQTAPLYFLQRIQWKSPYREKLSIFFAIFAKIDFDAVAYPMNWMHNGVVEEMKCFFSLLWPLYAYPRCCYYCTSVRYELKQIVEFPFLGCLSRSIFVPFQGAFCEVSRFYLRLLLCPLWPTPAIRCICALKK